MYIYIYSHSTSYMGIFLMDFTDPTPFKRENHMDVPSMQAPWSKWLWSRQWLTFRSFKACYFRGCLHSLQFQIYQISCQCLSSILGLFHFSQLGTLHFSWWKTTPPGCIKTTTFFECGSHGSAKFNFSCWPWVISSWFTLIHHDLPLKNDLPLQRAQFSWKSWEKSHEIPENLRVTNHWQIGPSGFFRPSNTDWQLALILCGLPAPVRLQFTNLRSDAARTGFSLWVDILREKTWKKIILIYEELECLGILRNPDFMG